MPTISVSIPEEMKTEMDITSDINWSAVARDAIQLKLNQLRLFKSIVQKSKLSEADAVHLAKVVNKAMHERHRKAHAGDSS